MINKYISITDAAREKKKSRTSIYVAVGRGKLDSIFIAGKQLIIVNKKYREFKK